ncbi:hypothetical protein [Micromonospora zamorensis]|uniref:hypothetical protein n=1 Tax=Micromonospora zamorensis TaxID=709883 RepID=UPI00081FC27B|nr:hypothetical protein [Micromonospora zamorensis]SCG38227.1 Phage gp6-like head-tail connector protein [Micromonospora zamorensis]
MAWAPDYITADELKAYVRVDDDLDDADVADAVTAASRAVDTHCHRQFGQVATAQTRQYTATWDRYQRAYVAAIDDLMVADSLTVVDANANEVTGYELRPVNAVAKGKPYTEITLPGAGAYQLTGLWGWDAVPAAVKLATKLQGSRFLARRDSPFGIAGSPTMGSELRLLARVDPDVAVSLGKYVRQWWAA